MEWVLIWIVIIILLLLVLACLCINRVRRACCQHGCNMDCFKRIDFLSDDMTYEPILKLKEEIKEAKKAKNSVKVKQLRQQLKEQEAQSITYKNILKDVQRRRKETLQKKDPIGDIEMNNKVSRLQTQTSNVLDEDEKGNKKVKVQYGKNIELKQEIDAKGKVQFYLEKKWNIERDTRVGRVIKFIYNSWLFSPLTFFIWEVGIVFIFSFFVQLSLSGSVITALGTYITAFVGIFSVLLSLLFANGVEKNKENKRLFQALCGDIKGMAMWIGALTNNKDKYKTFDKDENDKNSGYASIFARDTFEVETEKIRLLLAVLAPVAKHVLRNAPSPDNPNYDMLDDKLRIRIDIPDETNCCGGFQQMLISWGITQPVSQQDESQAWSKLDPNKDVNQIKVYLYKKVKLVSENSGMDLFEVVMYCLLDAINQLNELPEGFLGKAGYSKERDFISKWQHIYSSWGTMASITTYRQPTLVHITIFFCLGLYTVAITILNRNLSYINFTNGGGGSDYYSDWTSSVDVVGDVDVMWTSDWWYFHMYVFLKSMFQIIPFTWLYFLSNHIGKPFKKGMPDAEVISKDARDTQYQVSNLMINRAFLDTWDMTRVYSEQLETLNRDTYKYNSGEIYPFKTQEEEKKKNMEEILRKSLELKKNEEINTFRRKQKQSRVNRRTARNSLTGPKLEEAVKAATNSTAGEEKKKETTGGQKDPDGDRESTSAGSTKNPNGVQRRRVRYKKFNF